MAAGFALFLGIMVSFGPGGSEAKKLVDRIAVVVGDDIITLRAINEMEAYLRYRRDHQQANRQMKDQGRLFQEAIQEAITRSLLSQKLRADPDFRVARGRARQEIDEAVEEKGLRAYRSELREYGLTVERFKELERTTRAIQDYVRTKYRYAILPTSVQIEQTIQSHSDLKRKLRKLSQRGQREVRELISRQLELKNYLAAYERFVKEYQADVPITKVFEPEAP